MKSDKDIREFIQRLESEGVAVDCECELRWEYSGVLLGIFLGLSWVVGDPIYDVDDEDWPFVAERKVKEGVEVKEGLFEELNKRILERIRRREKGGKDVEKM
jgi:hypothetical protein